MTSSSTSLSSATTNERTLFNFESCQPKTKERLAQTFQRLGAFCQIPSERSSAAVMWAVITPSHVEGEFGNYYSTNIEKLRRVFVTG